MAVQESHLFTLMLVPLNNSLVVVSALSVGGHGFETWWRLFNDIKIAASKLPCLSPGRKGQYWPHFEYPHGDGFHQEEKVKKD